MSNKPRGKPFEKGNSGNPSGRPNGARNRALVAVEALLEGELDIILRNLIEAAKAGDMAATRIIMDRVLPTRRRRPISIDLPTITDAASAAEALDAILSAVSRGDLLLDEANELNALIASRIKLIETVDIEARISRAEKQLNE